MQSTITVSKDSEFLSEAVFDHFLERHSNLPNWLVKQKQQSWESYQELPAPSRKMESWRFANVKGLGVEEFRLAPSLEEAKALELQNNSNHIKETTAKLVFGNDDLLMEESLPEELAAQGVIFEPLERAFAKHSEILEEFFMAQESALGAFDHRVIVASSDLGVANANYFYQGYYAVAKEPEANRENNFAHWEVSIGAGGSATHLGGSQGQQQSNRSR